MKMKINDNRFKMGDTVYVIDNGRIVEKKVYGIWFCVEREYSMEAPIINYCLENNSSSYFNRVPYYKVFKDKDECMKFLLSGEDYSYYTKMVAKERMEGKGLLNNIVMMIKLFLGKINKKILDKISIMEEDGRQ